TEGIMPAIESAHALAGALQLGRELGEDAVILVSLSGRGDKDVDTASSWFGLEGDEPARGDLSALRAAARETGPAGATTHEEPRCPPPTPTVCAPARSWTGHAPRTAPH